MQIIESAIRAIRNDTMISQFKLNIKDKKVDSNIAQAGGNSHEKNDGDKHHPPSKGRS